MKELLEELQKTDPACYEAIARGLEQVDIEYEEDIIQGACQRAIAARGLYQTIEARSIEPYLWRALVMRVDGRTFDHEAVHASPAKSILSAYLSAIRSQPCQS